MRNWRCLLPGVLVLALLPANLPAQDPPGKADELRAQLEKLQSALRDIELRDEQRGKVTEIGSSRGRVRDTDEPRLVVKVYDLSDLFTVAPSYPAYEPTELTKGGDVQPVFPYVEGKDGGGSRGSGAGGFGGGGGGLFVVPNMIPSMPATLHQGSGASGAPASNVRTSMDGLIETITSTIDPDGWSDVGGPSTIAPVGSSLLISTTSATHAKLTALIDVFRQRWGSLRTISIQANWLWLSPLQVDEIVSSAKPVEGIGGSTAPNTVAPDVWKKLLVAAVEKEGAGSGYHAIVTCYNGQTIATQAGTQRVVVTGMQPVVGGGQSPVAYAPVTRIIHEGATLQITPLATRHVKYVVLDVHSRVNLITPVAKVLEKVERLEVPVAGDPRLVTGSLDRTPLQTQRLETTLRIPVGQATLIGGMTFAGEGKNSHLYLFITAKVQELRDDDPVATPTVATPAAPAGGATEKPLEKK